MSKQALLLIHGMGSFTAPGVDDQGKTTRGSFGEEFLKASTESLQRYENHKTETLEKYVDIHEFNFDAWFQLMRDKMAERAESMTSRLDAIGNIYGATFATDLAGKLNSLERDFGKDEFFYTHWLDVLFYTTMLGAKVRVELGIRIAGLVEEYGPGRVHVMAHSLGTAVLHDTLHLIYRPESVPGDPIPDLHPTNHKLGSVWMVANVSRLINSFTALADPLTSVVKPGDEGCTNTFFNIRHKMDPFTWLSRFDPANNGSWIPESIYSTAYNQIVTDLVIDGNTHSFTQYLLDPKVAEVFLYQMTPFKVTLPEMDRIVDGYSRKSINGAYAALEGAFHNLSVKDSQSWRDFLQSAEVLQEVMDSIRNGL